MPSNKKKDLSTAEKQEIANFLLENSEKGRLKRGFIKAAQTEFKRSSRTISRIWSKIRSSITHRIHSIDLSRQTFKSGRKRKDRTNLKERIKQVAWNKRQTLRSLSATVAVPVSSLHNMFKRGEITRTKTTLKPSLTRQNMINRMEHCLSMLNA